MIELNCRNVLRASRGAAVCAAAFLSLAACNSTSSGTTGASGPLAPGLLSFGSPSLPPSDPINEDFTCPPIIVGAGGAAIRAGAAEGGNVRNQTSITNIARECTNIGMDGSFTLKVGVEGRVLIGPSGGAGTFGVPVRIAVTSGEKPFITRNLRTSVAVPAGTGSAPFVLIEEGIRVPGNQSDLEIVVSLGGGAAERPARRRR
ncbi:MAG: hypothetical protein ACRCUX_01865 [Beijerinckiaceae bacterium]